MRLTSATLRNKRLNGPIMLVTSKKPLYLFIKKSLLERMTSMKRLSLQRGSLSIATYSIYKLRATWCQRRLIKFSHDKSMRAKDHQGVANSDLRGMVGMIYLRQLDIATYKIYISCSCMFES